MSNYDEGRRLIFVGGAPRSGTTLLQNILDSHEDVAGGPEFDNIPEIVRLRDRLQKSISNGRTGIFRSQGEVDAHVCSLIEGLLLPFADERKKSFLSEKTPDNVLVFNQLLKICPKAKFIFVIRDPRAIIASLMEVGKKAAALNVAAGPISRHVPDAICHVQDCFKAGFDALRFAPDRILPVVYEELVADPEGRTKKICGFLGIGWSRDMLRPGEKPHAGEAGLDGVFYDSKTYYRNIEKSEVDKWKGKLNSLQIVRINGAFKDNGDLNRIGYEFTDADISWPVRFFSQAVTAGGSLAGRGISALMGIPPIKNLARRTVLTVRRLSRRYA
ncbi:MAG: sulfotransferase [Deltaproteobacteria bacterium]|nr:sulfotransferase [Deltaproteobacteria bacterium]